MADYKTHLTISTLLGLGSGSVAYGFMGFPAETCLLGAGLCSVSGMLPDLDSGPGVPLRESLSLAAAALPMLLIPRMQQFGLTNEMIVLAGAALYFLIRFGLRALLVRFTVHRGIIHSIPVAFLFGQLAFLISSGTMEVRIFKASMVILGFLSHLVLDEIYSVQVGKGILGIGLKNSFGTALKMFGKGILPNGVVFAQIALLMWVILNEPPWMTERFQHQSDAMVVEKSEKPAISLDSAIDQARDKWNQIFR